MVGEARLNLEVSFGSLADTLAAGKRVGFTPESGHVQHRRRGPQSAISGHFSRVPVEDYKVTKIAGLRGAFGILLAGRIADVDDHGLGNLRGNWKVVR
jgi:hypothetical protein